MNKVILMGRLTRDPELRYSQSAEPFAICRFSLAVQKRFKRENESDADFINCVALGKNGEFIERYFKKGKMILVNGRLSVRSWEDQDGKKRWSTEVIVDESYFTESKSVSEGSSNGSSSDDYYASIMTSQPKDTNAQNSGTGFSNVIDESIDDGDEELPF